MSHIWVKISNFKPTLESIKQLILDHREEVVSEIVNKYIGKSFTHGLIFKKTYNIETRADAIQYIKMLDNHDYWEWYWDRNAFRDSIEKIDELINALQYSDEEFAQISVKDINIVTPILRLEKYKHLDVGFGRYA